MRAGFPDVAAVAWLKITAFTLPLKNSSSDHLFSGKSSSSVVFPRPLQPPRHSPRVSRCLAVIWMCDILCFCLISLPVSLPKKAAVSSSCLGVLVHPGL